MLLQDWSVILTVRPPTGPVRRSGLHFPRGVNLVKIPEFIKNFEFFKNMWLIVFFIKHTSFFRILKNTFIGIYSLFIIISGILKTIFAYRSYSKPIVIWLEQGFSRIKYVFFYQQFSTEIVGAPTIRYTWGSFYHITGILGPLWDQSQIKLYNLFYGQIAQFLLNSVIFILLKGENGSN